MRGKLSTSEIVPCWLAQSVGAVAAGLAAFLIMGSTFAPAPGQGVSVGSAVLVEILCIFALYLVVLNCATSKATEGSSCVTEGEETRDSPDLSRFT